MTDSVNVMDAEVREIRYRPAGAPQGRPNAWCAGLGRYTDDINLPGQAFAVMVRSPIAHGVLNGD